MPILLGGILKSAGIKANVDIPVKAKYMIKDCKLWAEKNNIEFKFNSYFPIKTLDLMRCVLVAQKKGFAQNFINKVFDAIWKDGLNLNDNTVIEKLLKNLDINPETFLAEATNQKIKDALKKNTSENILSVESIDGFSMLFNLKKFPDQKRTQGHLLYQMSVSYIHEIAAGSLVMFVLFFFHFSCPSYHVCVTLDVCYSYIISFYFRLNV